MRVLLLLCVIAVVACTTPGQTGTIGLPSERAATAAPTARPLSPSPSASATASPSASPSASPAASSSPSPTQTPARTATAPPTAAPATPTPTLAPPPPRPAVRSISGTQVSLTVVFTSAMRSGLACGTTGRPASQAGAIDDLSPAALSRHYAVADRALQESIQSSQQATVTADCAAVILHFGLAAPSGSFEVTVQDVFDREDRPIDPSRVSGTAAIADEGRPAVVKVEATSDVIVVTYTEPMLLIGEGGGAAMMANYALDGTTPQGAVIGCLDAGCRRVQITLRAGTLVAGRGALDHQLRIANVVDRAGRNLSPDPTTITFRVS